MQGNKIQMIICAGNSRPFFIKNLAVMMLLPLKNISFCVNILASVSMTAYTVKIRLKYIGVKYL